MKKKRSWILLAILANLALLPMVRGEAAGAQQRGGGVLYHCCKKTTAGKPYCCNRCCVFRFNCLNHEMCERRDDG